MIQNHLLQVVALLAMEPPVDAEPDSLRDEKVKILKAMRPADPGRLVRGQYQGYRGERGVAPARRRRPSPPSGCARRGGRSLPAAGR